MKTTSLKTVANNFVGEVTTRYRLKPVLDSKSFSLFYEIELNNNWESVSCTTSFLESHPTTADCMADVLERASKKYGIQLTKANLKVVA